MIPKAEHVISLSIQPTVSRFIVAMLCGVLPTIQLHNQLFLQTDKIDYIWTDRSLPAKFTTTQLTHSQMAPENLFSIGEMTP